MPKAWTDKGEYKRLAGELTTSEGREFERRALPLLRVIWADAVAPQALGSFDRSGADILVWSDTKPFPLVVQCKGFRADEIDIGDSQIRQCQKSIASFRKSGLEARAYVLVHNRTLKNDQLRNTINAELRRLVESGRVVKAMMWGWQELLRAAFNSTLAHVRRHVALSAGKAKDYYGAEQPLCEPLEEVPFRGSTMVANPHRLVRESAPVESFSDPSAELLKTERANLSIMIGQAGYGKTTAALRTFGLSSQIIFYVPAATIPSEVNSKKLLIKHCVRLDDLWDGAEPSDMPTLERLTYPVVEYILKDRDAPMALILDGLDESVYFSRPGGLQALLNQIREVSVPVILLARSEFWHERQADFATSYGIPASSGESQHVKFRLIELTEWGDEQIKLLATRYRDSLADAAARRRLTDFVDLIGGAGYESLYGDIPRRPLFLRFILECVAQRGVERTGRALLFYEWAVMKIQRDIFAPRRWGNVGRAPLLSENESPAAVLRLAFRAMKLAAERMTAARDGMIELLPSCALDDILLSDEQLKRVDEPSSLFLNSLLVPVASSHTPEPLEVRFAHRTYQEFFLAMFVKETPGRFKTSALPQPVREYLEDLVAEEPETP
jgi:hypothetical protein